ncbi:hypothetical protein KP79_PYT10894 [Mizuhopecten yessoensis]|uniref:Uncharacterized protein n=1 Tax=Mizuhopecten yessoensis TaxID=6573 RepID=A0A210Q256_MIZYE|nr:hypothetical protein KP79_PYT10894 [Mizuhopecten yessoensis]
MTAAEILNFLPCANNYDIQVKMFETYIKFVSAIWIIVNWPDPVEDAYNTMICRAFFEFKSETDESIGEHCSAEDVTTFGEFYSAMTSKMLSKHSCDEDHLNH